MERTIEELFETPCRVVDILPAQVPRHSSGQYFAVEKYFLQKDRLAQIKQKHINVLLKLNCYRQLSFYGEEGANPPPERIAEAVQTRRVCILSGESLIVSEPDETWLTVFNADEALLRLLGILAAAEGLFLWDPQ